ncbi:MAG: protein kinase [Kiritimatiellae bacterium]|nr:protein kinase [Kiritimatiellia bacterium]
MPHDTISDAATMQGGTQGTLLAGRYHIVRQLGQGGMGSVWLAEDTQLDNKQFAIKMLPSILVSNKRAYRQLKDEALVAMKLTHPNIVQIRAFEENNGNPFLVMDYIDGETLDDYLAEVGNGEDGTGNGRAASTRPPSGGLPEDEVIRLLKPIAAALDYAHSKGVVHRDVKPGNVMIAKDGTPYILDFGIAREIQETMTRVTGKLSSGTLLYMSPEQLNGDAPTPAQDIYAFAAMVYECLKGEPPFVRGAIEDQIKNKVPDPPVGRGDPTAPLIAGIMAGLAKKPEDRPPTCAAVLVGDGFQRKAAESQGDEGPKEEDGDPGRVDPCVEATVEKEHVERVESSSPPKRTRAGIAFPIFCIVAALLAIGGVLWHRGQQRKQAERRRIVAAQKTVHKQVQAIEHSKVQLWEGGPYWADRNIGAENPWDYGYYFWWGDTVGYKRVNDAWVASDGSSSNFAYRHNTPTFAKSVPALKSAGWITVGNVLSAKHDAARVQWGGGWRMPTKQEIEGLCRKCDWTWTMMNDVRGYIVRGRGDYASASIFLPASGYGYGTSLDCVGSDGYYWSSVPDEDSNNAWCLDFYSGNHSTPRYARLHGQSVRPVKGFTK